MLDLNVKIDTHNTLANLDKLLRNIEDSPTVIEEVADEMVEAIIVQAQINWTSYSHPYETGNLMSSIHSEGNFPVYQILVDATDKYGAEYGQFLEFGTSTIQAMPFLWPAINQTIADYKIVFKDELARAIRG